MILDLYFDENLILLMHNFSFIDNFFTLYCRFDFKFRSGIAAYIDSIKGAYIVMHASTIRYRKSLNFLQKYSVKTRLVYFDDR